MKSLLTILALLSINAQAAGPALNDVVCYDAFTFVPMKFTLHDDGVAGPTIVFEGQQVPSIIHALGMGPVTFQTGKKLTLQISGQPKKAIHQTDSRIRQYTMIGLKGDSQATFVDDKGNAVTKAFTAPTIDITKSITAAGGERYSIHLTLRHLGKLANFTKGYYTRACRQARSVRPIRLCESL